MKVLIKWSVFGIVSIFTFGSCYTEEGCRRGMKNLGSHEANILLYEKPKKYYEDYILIGKDLVSLRDTTVRLKGRWYETLGKVWDSGDTVIKNKGELTITVKKQDGSVRIGRWTCEYIYLDGDSVRNR